MPHTDNSSGTIRVGLGALTKEKLGCRSHMFESSFFSALCAYKKLLELCAGTPNRHFLNKAPRPARMVIWLSAQGVHFLPPVKCVEVHLIECASRHQANLSLYSKLSAPRYLQLFASHTLKKGHVKILITEKGARDHPIPDAIYSRNYIRSPPLQDMQDTKSMQ